MADILLTSDTAVSSLFLFLAFLERLSERRAASGERRAASGERRAASGERRAASGERRRLIRITNDGLKKNSLNFSRSVNGDVASLSKPVISPLHADMIMSKVLLR